MRAYSNDRESDQLANLIFAPDPSSHFRYEHVHGVQRISIPPEIRALMLAVLEDGIACFQGCFFKPSRTNEKLFLEAEEWIGSNDDGVFSFNNICETLGINPNKLRKGLERWRERQIAGISERRKRLIANKDKCAGTNRKPLENQLY